MLNIVIILKEYQLFLQKKLLVYNQKLKTKENHLFVIIYQLNYLKKITNIV